MIRLWMALREVLQGPMREPLSVGRIVRVKLEPEQRRRRITKRTNVDAPVIQGGLWVYELDGRATPVYCIYDFTPMKHEW